MTPVREQCSCIFLALTHRFADCCIMRNRIHLLDRNYTDAHDAYTFITKVRHMVMYCSLYLCYLKNYNIILLMDFIAPVNPPALVTC